MATNPAEAGRLPQHGDIKKFIVAGATTMVIVGAIALGYPAIRSVIDGNSPRGHIITSNKFDQPPPLRIPDKINSSQQGELPIIKEYKDNWFNPGLTFQLDNQTDTTLRMRYPDFIDISGYLIAEKTNPDGSMMFAIGIPGENGELLTQEDIDTSPTSVSNISSDGNQGKISSAIVWVKAQDFIGYSLPFVFNSTWNENFSALRGERTTNSLQELKTYIGIGYPVQVLAETHITPGTQRLLEKNYKESAGNMSYEEALVAYSDIVTSNADTIRKILGDVNKGDATLRTQLKSEIYTITARGIDFVPVNQA